ncbi:hypothetical protein ACHAWX_001345 [Stephanocyclus meneghinianus]
MKLFDNKDNMSQDTTKEGEKEETADEWIWDGFPIEGAHDEEFEPESDDNDALTPSLSFMSMTNSFSSILETTTSYNSKRYTGKLDSPTKDEVERQTEDDLLEIGGDPFFVEDEWSWDGIPIEGAHDEEFERGSGEIDNDVFVPSASFMITANSVAPSIFDRPGFDPFRNAGQLHQRNIDGSLSEDDLLDVGGDPFFLDDEDRLDSVFKQRQMELDQPNDFEWDGTVDEDAHLDFD